MADMKGLVEAYNRQFDIQADLEETEDGSYNLVDNFGNQPRSTKSVRMNWLRRNAHRFGFERRGDGFGPVEQQNEPAYVEPDQIPEDERATSTSEPQQPTPFVQNDEGDGWRVDLSE